MSKKENSVILTAAKTEVVVINTKIIEIEARMMELNLMYRELLEERENAIQNVKKIKQFLSENADISNVTSQASKSVWNEMISNPNAGVPRYLSDIEKMCDIIMSDDEVSGE